VVGGINVCFKLRMGCLSEYYYPMIQLKLNENGKVNSSDDFNAGGERWGKFLPRLNRLYFSCNDYISSWLMLQRFHAGRRPTVQLLHLFPVQVLDREVCKITTKYLFWKARQAIVLALMSQHAQFSCLRITSQ
jgi:hypothetical protein